MGQRVAATVVISYGVASVDRWQLTTSQAATPGPQGEKQKCTAPPTVSDSTSSRHAGGLSPCLAESQPKTPLSPGLGASSNTRIFLPLRDIVLEEDWGESLGNDKPLLWLAIRSPFLSDQAWDPMSEEAERWSVSKDWLSSFSHLPNSPLFFPRARFSNY
uniref:Uncharacterized protein n=1 Tax=Oryza officinalis TaxID=4535 RepID=A0A1V1H0W6_9ORYZ|nr:hypothetical protein [Oryza officinalis]